MSSHTSCQGCIFAEVDFENISENNSMGIVQTGCKLNLLERYSQTYQIIDAYNEEGSFYIINGRLCYFKRNKDWANTKDNNRYEDEIRKEQMVPYVSFIIGNDYIEDCIVTIKDADNQDYRPRLINLILQSPSKVDKKELFNWMSSLRASWKVSYLGEDYTFDEYLDDFILLHNQKYPIYQVVGAGQHISSNLMTRLNNKIIMDDFRFCRISTKGIIIGNSSSRKLAPSKEEFYQATLRDIL